MLKTFTRTRDKMHKRYERAYYSLHQLPKGLNVKEYYAWVDTATKARKEYVRGEISAEEALKIIEVND